MGKLSQVAKVFKGKMQGKNQEEIAEELMKDGDFMDMIGKLQKGVQDGKISQSELMEMQKLAQTSPKEVEEKLDELLGRVEE